LKHKFDASHINLQTMQIQAHSFNVIDHVHLTVHPSTDIHIAV